jgi:hypothetical protein
MRFPCALFACLLSATISLPAAADSRVFVIAAQADGYGIDQCLASGDRCGAPAARAYCQSREFTDASASRALDASEITATTTSLAGGACRGSACGRAIAITCMR